MEMSGEQQIAAPKQTVWDALNDPDTLKACITGCQTLEKTTETHLEASVKAAVGPVKATFKGEVDLENIDPPNSYTLSGQGKGGAAGFAKGSADVALEENADGTLLRYTVKANVGGQLARIGSRLIDGAAKKYADEFFTAFKATVEAAEEPVAEPAQSAVDLEAVETAEEAVAETVETAQEPTEPVVAPEAAPEPAAPPTPEPASETQITPTEEPDTSNGVPAFVWGGALAVAVILAIVFLL
ncbi:MAG: carbon monoxide dehydrogenase subunit G [Pseudomonadota bacterium]